MRAFMVGVFLLISARAVARDAPVPAGSRTDFIRDGVRYRAVPIRIGAEMFYACCKTEPVIP